MAEFQKLAREHANLPPAFQAMESENALPRYYRSERAVAADESVSWVGHGVDWSSPSLEQMENETPSDVSSAVLSPGCAGPQ